MHMPSRSSPQLDSSFRTLEAQRLAAGATQQEWAARLGVSQGHYCKIISGKAKPGIGLTARVRQLATEAGQTEFETKLLEVARTVPRFQSLLRLLLDMHFHASKAT